MIFVHFPHNSRVCKNLIIKPVNLSTHQLRENNHFGLDKKNPPNLCLVQKKELWDCQTCNFGAI